MERPISPRSATFHAQLTGEISNILPSTSTIYKHIFSQINNILSEFYISTKIFCQISTFEKIYLVRFHDNQINNILPNLYIKKKIFSQISKFLYLNFFRFRHFHINNILSDFYIFPFPFYNNIMSDFTSLHIRLKPYICSQPVFFLGRLGALRHCMWTGTQKQNGQGNLLSRY